MRSIASVARWAAYLLVTATMLVVIVACPEGPVGDTGETGGTGEKGPPGGVAPVAINTIAPQAVQAGSTTTAMDIAKYFNEPQDQALTYTAVSADATVATASITGSMLTITGVAVGTTTVVVVATDTEGLNAKQAIAVTVTAQPPALTPYSACTADPLNTASSKTCKVTLEETQLLRSADPAKVTVSPDGASRTVWVVTAVDRTGDAGVEIKVLEVADEGARHEEIGMFTVVVANSLPTRKADSRPPDPGIKLAKHDADGSDRDFPKQPAMTYYYTHAAGLGGYFEDSDASDGIVFKKANIRVSDPAHVIVRHVDSDGSDIYFDVVQMGSGGSRQNFTITVFAEDKAGGVSEDSVVIQYEWPNPREWTYKVTQTAAGGFQTRPVGLRRGVEHKLMFEKYDPDGPDDILTTTDDNDANLLRLVNTVVATDLTTPAGVALLKEVNDARHADAPAITGFATLAFTAPAAPAAAASAEVYLSVTGSGAAKGVGDLDVTAITDPDGEVTFMVDHTGTGTITFVVKAWYRAKTAPVGKEAWHDIASTKRTLNLTVSHVGAGTTTYSQ